MGQPRWSLLPRRSAWNVGLAVIVERHGMYHFFVKSPLLTLIPASIPAFDPRLPPSQPPPWSPTARILDPRCSSPTSAPATSPPSSRTTVQHSPPQGPIQRHEVSFPPERDGPVRCVQRARPVSVSDHATIRILFVGLLRSYPPTLRPSSPPTTVPTTTMVTTLMDAPKPTLLSSQHRPRDS